MHKMARPEDRETTRLIGQNGNIREISVSSAKCSVYTFFPICYIVLIILAGILKSYIEEWSTLTTVNLSVVTSLVISAGSFGLIFSFICWCEGKETVFFGITYIFIMTLQIAAIVYGCIQIADKNHVMKKTMEADMKNNFNIYSFDIKKAFDGLQIEKSCCGIYSVKDYTQLNRKIPLSCCESNENMDTYCTDTSKAYQTGCAAKMYDDIVYNIGILSYTTIGAVVLQIFLGLCGLAIIL